MSVQKSTPVTETESNSILDAEEMESSEDMEDVYSSLVEELTTLVITGRESEEFEELMDAIAVAGSYSARNKFLIKVQDPEAIGPFNGYNQWINEFGRVPEKGSSALWVLAPKTVTYCEETDEKAKYCDECEDECENTREVIVDYVSVPTFAYSQTTELDEEDKPEDVKDVSVITEKQVETNKTQEKLSEWYESLANLYESEGFEVNEVTDPEEWDMQSSARGFFKHDDNSVTVRNFKIGDEEEVNIAQRLSTLIHELAHSYLQHDEANLSDAREEMEAEAVAYTVCKRLGVETDAGVYISSHLRTEIDDLSDREEVSSIIEDSVERIAEITSKILNGLR